MRHRSPQGYRRPRCRLVVFWAILFPAVLLAYLFIIVVPSSGEMPVPWEVFPLNILSYPALLLLRVLEGSGVLVVGGAGNCLPVLCSIHHLLGKAWCGSWMCIHGVHKAQLVSAAAQVGLGNALRAGYDLRGLPSPRCPELWYTIRCRMRVTVTCLQVDGDSRFQEGH